MLVPSARHRVNSSRAIFVNGEINRELVRSLTPAILRLQEASRDPITVYIDSPGGEVSHMETILRLLRLSNQDSAPPCHVITAVATRAASAAADLLSSGDYSVAYPSASILYHGLRTDGAGPLTVERTSMLGWWLRAGNDQYAMSLAKKVADRFSFRFMTNRTEFGGVRSAQSNPDMTDVECFVAFVEKKLSAEAKKLWQKARDRHARYEEIFNAILRKSEADFTKMTVAQAEGESIKAIVEYEIAANASNSSWTFGNRGFLSLADDFFLLREHVSAHGHERLKRWSTQFGKLLLSQEQVSEIEKIENEDERNKALIDKVQPILEPLWTFFIALCHALQEGENELTALDAYWLGLVDEVVGLRLLSFRDFAEFQPDPPQRIQE